MRLIFSFIGILLFLSSCERSRSIKQSDDFSTLMGANSSLWQYVETHEDFQNIDFFQKIYEKNKTLLFSKEKTLSIPKVMHFVWLGPKSFPKESIENVYSWVRNHPDWKFKFWTDTKRPTPHPRMELHLISNFEFKALKECFLNSDNYAEKSDVLRYEILYKEGGLYVDHDVKCYRPFTSFHYSFDLYCGLEPPHQPILSSSVTVTNNLIGVIPKHPVMGHCIQLVKSRWDKIGKAYPARDKDSIIYRVAKRSFSPFEEAFKIYSVQEGKRDIVFPAAYFNKLNKHSALFAHHYYASTWFTDESKFEKNVRRGLVRISRKNNQILLFNGVILIANLFLFSCLLFQFRKISRCIHRKK